jgi:hypothetical protein
VQFVEGETHDPAPGRPDCHPRWLVRRLAFSTGGGWVDETWNAGPFWVSTSTRGRRRPAKDRLSGNDKILIVVALAALGAVVYGGAYAVAWPLIVFHHRQGWPYAWKAEGWWVGGWIAAA